MQPSVILGNVLGLVGLIVAAYYFRRPGQALVGLERFDNVYVDFRLFFRRRRIMATVTATAAILLLIAINVFDDTKHPAAMMIWLLILILVPVLAVLAWLDLQTLRNLRTKLQRIVDRNVSQTLASRQVSNDDEQ